MICPECNSTRIVWYVLVPTMKNVKRDIENCADCKRIITNKDYEVFRYAEEQRRQYNENKSN